MNAETPHSTEPELFRNAHSTEGRRRWWPWLVGLALAAAVVLALLFGRGDAKPKGGDKARAVRAVPVTTATVRSEDVARYVTGLGTVTPLNTVTVRSRVDGQLLRVAFHEGQIVQQGDLLAELDPRPFQVQLVQAEGQRAKDEAALNNAKVDLARYRALIEQDAISRQQLDTQAATVAQFEAALESDRGQIESAKLNLAYCRIAAPLTGRIGLRLVDAGNMVHASDPNGLLVITQLRPIAVVFTIPGDQLPQVVQHTRDGHDPLTVEAYDRGGKTRLASGTLLAVDNQIDAATGTVRLKAQFPNSDEALFANQFVNARLLIEVLHGAVVAPSAALQRNPQATFVWRVKSDDTVEARNVDVQLTQGDDALLGSGLAAGDVVVIDGVDKLQQGSKVLRGSRGQGGAPGSDGGGPATAPTPSGGAKAGS